MARQWNTLMTPYTLYALQERDILCIFTTFPCCYWSDNFKSDDHSNFTKSQTVRKTEEFGKDQSFYTRYSISKKCLYLYCLKEAKTESGMLTSLGWPPSFNTLFSCTWSEEYSVSLTFVLRIMQRMLHYCNEAIFLFLSQVWIWHGTHQKGSQRPWSSQWWSLDHLSYQNALMHPLIGVPNGLS